MLLTDQGARTTKVTRAATSSLPAMSTWNRGKRLVEVGDNARDVISTLVAGADIVIDATSPGSPLDLGFDAIRTFRPNVVYCRLPEMTDRSAFGSDDVDGLVAAMTAVHQVSDKDATPHYNPFLLPSMLAAVRAASAVVAAVDVRDATSLPQRVEVSLHEAMLLAWGRHLVRKGRSTDAGARFPLVRQYRAADDRWVQLHGNFEPKWSRIVLEAAGHPELVSEAAEVVKRSHPDPDVDQMWRDRLTEFVAAKPAEAWEQAITDAGGACAVCRSLDEWLRLDHPRRAGLLIGFTTSDGDQLVQPGQAVAIEAIADQSASASGVGETAIEARERPLAGLRVLDLTILIAGPTAGRALAEYGADVIKIDDPYRVPSEWAWEDVNRGKRSILLDLKSDHGRDIFWRLVGDADVVLTNFRGGRTDDLGLGFLDVAARRPGIIYLSMNAYGHGGPWSRRPGWEQLVQASMGMQLLRSRDGSAPQVVTPWISDYGAGLLGAYGVLMAVRARRRGAGSQHVTTSLAQSLSLMESRFLLDARPSVELPVPGSRGEGPAAGLYEAADAWLYLQAPSVRELLTSSDAFATVASEYGSADALTTAIADIIRTRPVQEWIETLSGSTVDVAPVRRLDDIVAAQGPLDGGGSIVHAKHPTEDTVQYYDTRVAWERTVDLDLGRAPMPGEQTSAILAELAISELDQRALFAAHVVADHILD